MEHQATRPRGEGRTARRGRRPVPCTTVCLRGVRDRFGRRDGARAGRDRGRLGGVPVVHAVCGARSSAATSRSTAWSSRSSRSQRGARPTPERSSGDDAGTWSVRLTLASFIVTAVWTGAAARSSRTRSARGSWASSPSRSRSRCWSRCRRPGASSQALALFELLAGAAFLGSVLDGLLLGHWYLTDRGLSRTPIERATRIMLVAVVIEAIAVISGGFGGVGSSDAFNPLLTAGALAPWIALGMVGTTGLIAVMVKATLRGARASAVQSATGFFYLAVVTAFTAEVAVKVRFLPG